MRTLTIRRLAVPLLAVVAALALVLAMTLVSGSTADAAGHDHAMHGDHDEADGFGVSALLAGPATFTDDVTARFQTRYDRGRTLNAVPRDASNTITVEVTWEPGGSSGWHTHPGPVIVNVTEGEVVVTNAVDCVPRTYHAGEAFLDPGQGNVHIAVNGSDSEEAKAVGTFVGVPDGGPATIMAPPADC